MKKYRMVGAYVIGWGADEIKEVGRNEVIPTLSNFSEYVLI